MPNEHFYNGKEVNLADAKIYGTFCSRIISDRKTGVFYIYEETIKNNRIRICASKDDINKPCACTGWVNINDILIIVP